MVYPVSFTSAGLSRENSVGADDGIVIITVSMPLARPGRDLASQPGKKWVSESENSSTNPATIQ